MKDTYVSCSLLKDSLPLNALISSPDRRKLSVISSPGFTEEGPVRVAFAAKAVMGTQRRISAAQIKIEMIFFIKIESLLKTKFLSIMCAALRRTSVQNKVSG